MSSAAPSLALSYAEIVARAAEYTADERKVEALLQARPVAASGQSRGSSYETLSTAPPTEVLWCTPAA